MTTVPAVGNLALSLALWAPAEVRGSGSQLLVDVAGMLVAGVLMVWLQRLFRPTERP